MIYCLYKIIELINNIIRSHLMGNIKSKEVSEVPDSKLAGEKYMNYQSRVSETERLKKKKEGICKQNRINRDQESLEKIKTNLISKINNEIDRKLNKKKSKTILNEYYFNFMIFNNHNNIEQSEITNNVINWFKESYEQHGWFIRLTRGNQMDIVKRKFKFHVGYGDSIIRYILVISPFLMNYKFSRTVLYQTLPRVIKEDTCAICKEKPPQVLYESCGHLAICKLCHHRQRGQTCPLCRKQIYINGTLPFYPHVYPQPEEDIESGDAMISDETEYETETETETLEEFDNVIDYSSQIDNSPRTRQ